MNRSIEWWLTTILGALLAAWQFVQQSDQAHEILGPTGLFWGGFIAAALSFVLGATHQGRRTP